MKETPIKNGKWISTPTRNNFIFQNFIDILISYNVLWTCFLLCYPIDKFNKTDKTLWQSAQIFDTRISVLTASYFRIEIHLLIGRKLVTIWGLVDYLNNRNIISNDKQTFPIHLVTQTFTLEATLIL